MDQDHLHDLFAAFGPISIRKLFGGWGLFYDRIQFDLYSTDETQKITHPTFTVQFAPRGVAPAAGQVA